jgi:hypothetical protein
MNATGRPNQRRDLVLLQRLKRYIATLAPDKPLSVERRTIYVSVAVGQKVTPEVFRLASLLTASTENGFVRKPDSRHQR